MSLRLFDAHCHLQLDPIYSDIDDVITNAKASGISRISICGVNVGKDWHRVDDIATKYNDIIIPSYGIHPWWIQGNGSSSITCCNSKDVSNDTNDNENTLPCDWQHSLMQALSNNPHAHVGEVGLDKNIKRKVSMARQIDILTKHIIIARTYGRVLSLHCAGQWGKLLEVLTIELADNGSSNASGVLLHSCNSLPHNMVSDYLALPTPVYFSVNGKVTNEDMKTMIRLVPSHRLLIETDSPDQLLSSLLHEGAQYNQPANLVTTANIVADVLGIPLHELITMTFNNSCTLFKVT